MKFILVFIFVILFLFSPFGSSLKTHFLNKAKLPFMLYTYPNLGYEKIYNLNFLRQLTFTDMPNKEFREYFILDFLIHSPQNISKKNKEKLSNFILVLKSKSGEKCSNLIEQIELSFYNKYDKYTKISNSNGIRSLGISEYTCLSFLNNCINSSDETLKSRKKMRLKSSLYDAISVSKDKRCENSLRFNLFNQNTNVTVSSNIQNQFTHKQDCLYKFNRPKLIKIEEARTISDTIGEFNGVEIFYEEYRMRKAEMINNLIQNSFMDNDLENINKVKKLISYFIDYLIGFRDIFLYNEIQKPRLTTEFLKFLINLSQSYSTSEKVLDLEKSEFQVRKY
jgi:hypothetical protein